MKKAPEGGTHYTEQKDAQALYGLCILSFFRTIKNLIILPSYN